MSRICLLFFIFFNLSIAIFSHGNVEKYEEGSIVTVNGHKYIILNKVAKKLFLLYSVEDVKTKVKILTYKIILVILINLFLYCFLQTLAIIKHGRIASEKIHLMTIKNGIEKFGHPYELGERNKLTDEELKSRITTIALPHYGMSLQELKKLNGVKLDVPISCFLFKQMV